MHIPEKSTTHNEQPNARYEKNNLFNRIPQVGIRKQSKKLLLS